MTLDDMRREVAVLQNEAGKPCRCDGGCAPCAACIAAKKLSDYGKEDRNRRQSGPRISDIVRAVDNVTLGRFSSAHPNEANTPKFAPVKWIMHGDYAHVAGQPCAQCNPPSTLTLYRSCLANCYCPEPSPSGYKPLCMNCQQAHNLAPKIVAEMLGEAK